MWLIVAEKDKSARRIAKILFKDVEVLKRNSVKLYFSPSNKAFVLGLKGHIVEYDFPDELNDWRRTRLEDLLRARFVVKVTERDIVKTLIEIGRDVDRVTIATDYDREGEFIGFTALKVVRKVNPSVKVERVVFSALTPRDIRDAFKNPRDLDLNLAKSAEVRHKVDLLWGAVLTRLLSISANRFGREFLSVGRVQSPTLRLIVEREDQIRSFKSKYYYNALINVKGVYAKRRFEDEDSARSLLNSIESVRVLRFERDVVVERKPIPFNTTEFLKEASKFMKPDKAMRIAESLYMDGYISYPRTDNTAYPKTLNLKRLVEMFLGSEFGEFAEFVLKHGVEPSRGKETKDHPPIHPTSVASRDDLSKDEWKIYELVVKRFLATLSPNAKWEVKRVEFEHGFKAFGKVLLFEGWRFVYDYSKTEEIHIPDFKVGEVVVVEEKGVRREKTKPPSRYTTGKLIKVMEKLGLGTKSTRHEIIKKLYDRNYIRGDPIKPTNLAFAVINALKDCVEVVTLPDMTAKLEEDMSAIAEGRMNERDVLMGSVRFLGRVLKSVDMAKLGEIVKEGIERDREEIEKKSVGVCPECGGVLLVKRGKKRFVGCSSYPKCRFSVSLPQRGRLIVTSKVCDVHGVKILRVVEKGRKWEFCPICNSKI